MKKQHNSLIINTLKLSLLFCLSANIGCQSTSYYKKDFSKEEQLRLAETLIEGRGYYYQGTAGEQLILEESKNFDDQNGTIWREFGVPYLKRGFAAEYEDYYAKSIDKGAKDWQGWRGYLYLYFYRDYERAIADFDATDILTPDIVDYPQSTSVDFMRGICYLQLNNFEKAIEYFEKHYAHEENTAGVQYIGNHNFLYQGITNMKMGNLAKAEKILAEGIHYNEKNADLRYWQARCLNEQGKNRMALKMIRSAIVQFRKNYFNSRPYVEDFYQLYQPDLNKLEQKIQKDLEGQGKSI